MKNRILTCVILLFLFTQISAQNNANNDWFWQYPKPQGNTLRDIYVFDSTTAVAVGDLGTVIKTTDGGESWDVQHHAGGTSFNLSSVHFTDKMNGWACGDAWGYSSDFSSINVLLKTINGGKSWTEIKTHADLSFGAVCFVDADTGFVAGEGGILLKTTDGGISWDIKKMNDYIGEYLDVFRLFAITFTDKNTGYIVGAGYYGNQIYKTTDCGKTWQWNEHVILPEIFGGLNDIYFTDRNHGFITGDGGVFLRTTDSGNTWQLDTPGVYNHMYSTCFTDSLNGYLVGGGPILETTDGGRSWNEALSSQNILDALYKVRFTNKSTGWIVGVNGIIYKTTDAGKSWLPQREKNYNFNSIYFTDENTGWAVGEKGIILHTEDGGINWIKQYQNDSLILYSIYAVDHNTAFSVGAIIKGLSVFDRNGFIYSTTNGGQNWTRQDFNSYYGFNSIAFVNDSTGWISESQGTILKTTNKGKTWITAAFDSSINVYTGKIQFINPDIGWIDITYKTTDGGKTWNKQEIPSLSNPQYFFINKDSGWLAGEYNWWTNGDNDTQKNIYKTTDGGNSWILCGIPAFIDLAVPYYSSVYFINENTGWIAGGTQTHSTIIKTTDGGNIWYEQKGPSTQGISSIKFLNETIGYAAASIGIFKTKNGGGIISSLDGEGLKAGIPTNTKLQQNYPNPFNPATVISYQLSVTSDVLLKVYDILGREIKTLVDDIKKPGNYSVKFDGNGLSSGIYFYTLKTDNKVITKKMILLR